MQEKRRGYIGMLGYMSALMAGETLNLRDEVKLKTLDHALEYKPIPERIPAWRQTIDRVSGTPATPPVPAGCKEYFFKANGTFRNDGMLRPEVVYKCVAMNDKSAIKKFNKNYKAI